MATITAVRSGNWSDTSHVTGPWPGGSTPTTKPGVDDTVQSDEFVVTIDEDVHVALLESIGGGYFQVTDAPALPAVRTVMAAVLNSGSAQGALKISNPTGKVDITGSQTGGVGENAYAIYNNGTIGDIIGDQTGGVGESAYAIYNNGTIGDITGNVTTGAGAGAYGIYNYSSGTIGDITGNVTGGAGESAYGIFNNSSGTIGDITGNVTGGAGENARGIYNYSSGTIGDITGNVTGGAGESAYGIYNNGTMGDVTGNVTGGAGAGAYGIYNNRTMGDVNGNVTGGANWLFPIYGPFRLVANPANAITVTSSTDIPLTLSNDYPAQADVRLGVEYNRGTMTGELAAGGNIGPVSIVIGGGGIRIS